jgi:hypothetical protein
MVVLTSFWTQSRLRHSTTSRGCSNGPKPNTRPPEPCSRLLAGIDALAGISQ